MAADKLVSALRELVRLKDLSDRADKETDEFEYNALRDEYNEKKPAAWEAARRAISEHAEANQDPWKGGKFWMLEHDQTGEWLMDLESYAVTRDCHEALRFPSQDAARWKQMAMPNVSGFRFVPTEHSWLSTRAPNSAQGQAVAPLITEDLRNAHDQLKGLLAYGIGSLTPQDAHDLYFISEFLSKLRAAPPSEHVLPPLDAKVLRDLYDESVKVYRESTKFSETIYFIRQVRSTLGMVLKLMTNADGVIERTLITADEETQAEVFGNLVRRLVTVGGAP